MQLGERKLDRLAGGERLAEGLALARIGHALVDAVLRDADAGRRLADAVLVHEELGDREPLALLVQHRALRNAHAAQPHLGVIRRHVEGPVEVADLEAGRVRRHQEGRDAARVAGLSRRAREDDVERRVVEPAVEALLAVDHPVAAVAHGAGLEPGGVAAVIGLGEPEGDALRARDHALEQLRLLRGAAVAVDHVHLRKIPDDRRLVLEIVVQAEPLVRQVLADDRHREIAAALPAELLRQRVAKMAGAIGAPPHLGEQLLPLPARRPVRLPVRARVLAAVIEVLRVLALERRDLLLDEGVELRQLRLDLVRDAEVHCRSSS